MKFDGLESCRLFFTPRRKSTLAPHVTAWPHRRITFLYASSVTLGSPHRGFCNHTTELNIKRGIPCWSSLTIRASALSVNYYRTRWRCYKHISDPRRPRCATELINGNFPRVSVDDMRKFDDAHRQDVKLARKEGHSQPIASGAACTIEGKFIGHVTR